ncbi:hypothetical protein SY88_12400 [Clostridiales bacterium PH28_bin88]|nr:hypothetical protein SY88_12400 [Clostridiales bacterium PH28_bin88]
MRWGLVIDLRRCVGCQSCVVACKVENKTPTGVYWNKVFKWEEGFYPHARMMCQPMACMHCRYPPCVKACPVGASRQLPDGRVIVDAGICIGCRYCMVACPYIARSFVVNPVSGIPGDAKDTRSEAPRGTVSKCDFCGERIEQGLEPACVATCPSRARVFGDLDDPNSEIVRMISTGKAKPLREEAGTGPSVFYIW